QHERNMFFYVLSLFEMERLAKESPLPPDASPAQVAQWYEKAYLNLFGGKELNVHLPDDLKVRVIADPKGSLGKTAQNRYAEQARRFRVMLEDMERGIARIRYEAPEANQDHFAVSVKTFDPS